MRNLESRSCANLDYVQIKTMRNLDHVKSRSCEIQIMRNLDHAKSRSCANLDQAKSRSCEIQIRLNLDHAKFRSCANLIPLMIYDLLRRVQENCQPVLAKYSTLCYLQHKVEYMVKTGWYKILILHKEFAKSIFTSNLKVPGKSMERCRRRRLFGD